MPTNKIIYVGLLVIAASALLWVGAWLAKQVDWLLPYTGIAGILLVIVGMFTEVKKKKAAAAAQSDAGDSPAG